MKLVGSSMVVTVDLRPGVRVAAAWSGGPFVSVHAVTAGGFGVVLESLYIDELDRPRMQAGKPLAALERFVLKKLAAAGVDGYLADMVEDVETWENDRARELVLASEN